MKTIIAGSRCTSDYSTLLAAIAECPWEITEVISGGAKGVDTLAERWAAEQALPFQQCAANWQRFGVTAGSLRNRQMAAIAQALLAVWDGRSTGTAHMIRVAAARGLRTHVYRTATPGPARNTDREARLSALNGELVALFQNPETAKGPQELLAVLNGPARTQQRGFRVTAVELMEVLRLLWEVGPNTRFFLYDTTLAAIWDSEVFETAEAAVEVLDTHGHDVIVKRFEL